MTRTLEHVAKRISRDVGIPLTTSRRIAKKLNALAHDVEWAEPVDGNNWKFGPKRMTAAPRGEHYGVSRKRRRGGAKRRTKNRSKSLKAHAHR